MSDINLTNFAYSVLITWSIGLLPPVVIRYAIMRRPLKKGPATTLCILFWIFNFLLFVALGSSSKTHAVLFIIALISYQIYLRENIRPKPDETAVLDTARASRWYSPTINSKDNSRSSHSKYWLWLTPLLIASVLFAGGLFYLDRYSWSLDSEAGGAKAFQNSRWLMSVDDVRQANATSLVKAKSSRALWAAISLEGFRMIPGAKFEAFESPQKITLWAGLDASIVYLFLENKLIAYQIDIDAEDMGSNVERIIEALDKRFGNQTNKRSKNEDGFERDIEWEKHDQHVRFWVLVKSGHIDIRYQPVYEELREKLKKQRVSPF